MKIEKMTIKELQSLIKGAQEEIGKRQVDKIEAKVDELAKVLETVNRLATEIIDLSLECELASGIEDYISYHDDLDYLSTIEVSLEKQSYKQGVEYYIKVD